jgi:hypothetical protein
MKSLVLFSYKQPVEGAKFRWGVLCDRRDTVKHPVYNDQYRKDDPEFRRSRNLDTVLTRQGPRMFYKERQNWRLAIPFVGSLVSRFLPAG